MVSENEKFSDVPQEKREIFSLWQIPTFILNDILRRVDYRAIAEGQVLAEKVVGFKVGKRFEVLVIFNTTKLNFLI